MWTLNSLIHNIKKPKKQLLANLTSQVRTLMKILLECLNSD